MAKKKEIVDLSEIYWKSCNEENKELIQEYLDNATHLSKQSIEQYASALRIWACYLNKFCGNKHLTEVKSLEFMKYQNWLLKQGIYDAGIKIKRSAISNLNNHIILFHGDEYQTFRNFITKAIKTPETGKVYEKVPLTEEEYEKLCTVLQEKEEWQKLAYLKFTYTAGCRKNESRQLLKEVVKYKPIERIAKFRDKEGKEVTAPIKKYKTNSIKCKGKVNDAPRKLSFDADTLNSLNKWLEVRGEDNCPYMFISGKGDSAREVCKSGFNEWCKLFEKIIDRRIHPHLLRSSRATNLALAGVNVEAIRNLLGHKDSTTTKIYIVKDEDDDEDEIFV